MDDGNLKRRGRIFYVSEEDVLSLFCDRWKIPETVYFHFLDNVPLNCVVDRVWHAIERRSFGFLLLHPSFDIVLLGAEFPESKRQLEYETIRLLPDQGSQPSMEPGTPYRILREENARLRAVFGDLRNDSAAARAIRNDALVEAAGVIRTSVGVDKEDAVAFGVNVAFAMAILRLQEK